MEFYLWILYVYCTALPSRPGFYECSWVEWASLSLFGCLLVFCLRYTCLLIQLLEGIWLRFGFFLAYINCIKQWISLWHFYCSFFDSVSLKGSIHRVQYAITSKKKIKCISDLEYRKQMCLSMSHNFIIPKGNDSNKPQ